MSQDAADLIELFKERVAIMIHDGKQTEYEANRQAYFEIRRMVGRDGIPEEIRTMAADVLKSK